MAINYSKIGRATELTGKDRHIYRALEILPGVLAWGTLIMAVLFSFFAPSVAAVFIILFDVYWLLRALFFSFHLRVSYKEMRINMKINWFERLKKLEIEKNWQDVYHLIILPFYKEDSTLIGQTIQGLIDANYPKDKMIVVLSGEEKAGGAEETIREITERYGDKFFQFIGTVHPSTIPNEIAGKGSNGTWAGRRAKQEIDKLGLKYEDIIVSNFDIDTVVWPEYFARLTYAFLTTKDNQHASYQPVPFFNNNIWDAPAFARVISLSCSLWQLIQQMRPEHLRTFSSHSMSFKALVDVDFWQTNMVSEDSRIFFQCFLHYDGNYKTVPLYCPVSMDVNASRNLWKTLINNYKQQRRWGYGVENIPFFIFGFIKNKRIPIKLKLHYTFTILEAFWSWATNSLIIFLLGWLPLAVGGDQFRLTMLAFNLPTLTSGIMTLAMVGLPTQAIFAFTLLPPKPKGYSKLKYPMMFIQWILFPITAIFFGAIPGLEAQTRLMLGKYMGFWVTPKIREAKWEK